MKKITSAITTGLKYLKHHPFLVFLCLFVIIARLPLLMDQLIPFQFDHGKDAIGSLHMWLTNSPKLIGPWTSIPGLFFGPAWYYILLPGMVLSGGSPVASVVTMLILGLMTVVVTYRYFGKITATLLATSSLFYTITTSAWNPFPMVTVTMVILAVLKHLEHSKKLTPVTAVLLGFFAALGFHFSTAFAIFYPVLILASILFKRIKLSLKNILIAAGAFLVPFIPQLAFEVKHNFIQVKAVLAYLETGGSDPASWEKFQRVLTVTWGELQPIIVPPSFFSSPYLNTFVFVITLILLVVGGYYFVQSYQKKKLFLSFDAVLWFTLPILAFTLLHFNLWYVLPVAAFMYVLVGQVIERAPKFLQNIFIALWLLIAVSRVFFYINEDKASLQKGTTFLPNKQHALQYIYEQAGDKPFASYHYMPDIYDYPYQYLYFTSAMQGKRLPVEFSYKPGETTYIPEKMELMAHFSSQQDTREPEVIFYIVEKSENHELLSRWWSEQLDHTVVDEYAVSDVLTVYTATPLENPDSASN